MAAFDLAARGTALGRSVIRFSTVAVLVAVAGCSGPHHADWVIHSSIKVIGAPPAGGYRLIFPYIVGDLYGPVNTGAFVVPESLTPGGFTLDLNRTQAALQSELGPADFSMRFLTVVPHDTRLARLAPEALQRNGIDAVGRVEWLDGRPRRPLMLVYVDRPARIGGTFSRGGATLRYDIRVPKPGYVWIGTLETGDNSTAYTVVPPPRDLVLTITTGQK